MLSIRCAALSHVSKITVSSSCKKPYLDPQFSIFSVKSKILFHITFEIFDVAIIHSAQLSSSYVSTEANLLRSEWQDILSAPHHSTSCGPLCLQAFFFFFLQTPLYFEYYFPFLNIKLQIKSQPYSYSLTLSAVWCWCPVDESGQT